MNKYNFIYSILKSSYFCLFFAEFINPKIKGGKLTPEFSQNIFVKT